MSVSMIVLDKGTGFCPVGVRKTWQRHFDKFVIRVTGPEATNAYQDDHICASLKGVIDGAVNGGH